MKNIYIVRGQCGEYEKHEEWLVHAYPEASVAEAVATELNLWCKEHKCHVSDCPTMDENPVVEGRPPSDPKFRLRGYSGVEYDVVEVGYGP